MYWTVLLVGAHMGGGCVRESSLAHSKEEKKSLSCESTMEKGKQKKKKEVCDSFFKPWSIAVLMGYVM